jgi:hypothetical protein
VAGRVASVDIMGEVGIVDDEEIDDELDEAETPLLDMFATLVPELRAADHFAPTTIGFFAVVAAERLRGAVGIGF